MTLANAAASSAPVRVGLDIAATGTDAVATACVYECARCGRVAHRCFRGLPDEWALRPTASGPALLCEDCLPKAG